MGNGDRRGPTEIRFIGAKIVEPRALRQVRTFVWGALKRAGYAEGTHVIVEVQYLAGRYAMEAHAEEPDGRVYRLLDFDCFPSEGVPDERFASLLREHDIDPTAVDASTIAAVDVAVPTMEETLARMEHLQTEGVAEPHEVARLLGGVVDGPTRIDLGGGRMQMRSSIAFGAEAKTANQRKRDRRRRRR